MGKASGWQRHRPLARARANYCASRIGSQQGVAGGCTHVGLESTGEYWKPVFNILEGTCQVWLLNAQHIKAVPGRKTDVKDAQWIAELLAHGLVRPSFIPPRQQRELRDLTRYRVSFVRERATLINRVQKLLESTNLKLSSGLSNVL